MGHLGRTGETRNTGQMLASKTEGSGVVRVLCIEKIIVAVVHRDVLRRLSATSFHSNMHECNFIDTQKKTTAIRGSFFAKLSNVQLHYL